MEGEVFFYCPIIGRKVRIINRDVKNATQSFNMSEKKWIVGNVKRDCTGNCVGCSLL